MDTKILSTVVAVLAISSWIPWIQISHACSCMRAHPQTHYCNSQYVIHAMPENFTEDTENYMGYYHVKVMEVMKGGEDSIMAGLLEDKGNGTMKAAVWTSMMGSMCGVYLQMGVEYILGGSLKESGMQVNLCGLVVQYNSLTRRQKNGFKHKFRQNCDCQVNYCGMPGRPCMPTSPPMCDEPDPANCPPVTGEPLPTNECLMHYQSDMLGCRERHTLCRRRHGTCQWTDNNFNQICEIQTRRRHRH